MAKTEKIKIVVYSLLDGEHWEKLEDKLRDFLRENNIKAEIENSATGNSTTTMNF